MSEFWPWLKGFLSYYGLWVGLVLTFLGWLLRILRPKILIWLNRVMPRMTGAARRVLPGLVIALVLLAVFATYHWAVSLLPVAPPVGTVVAYYGRPDDLKTRGWLLCDGNSHNTKDYPELARLLNASGDRFTVPDLRGVFLRGSDYKRLDESGHRWRDPTPDRVPGDEQDFAIVNHTHSIELYSADPNGKNLARGGTGNPESFNLDDSEAAGGVTTGKRDDKPFRLSPDNVQTVSPDNVQAEIRPRNTAVNWIIKARRDRLLWK